MFCMSLPVTSILSLSFFVGFKQSGLQVQGQRATPWLHFQSGWFTTRRSPFCLQRLFPGRHMQLIVSHLLSSSGCLMLLLTQFESIMNLQGYSQTLDYAFFCFCHISWLTVAASRSNYLMVTYALIIGISLHLSYHQVWQ